MTHFISNRTNRSESLLTALYQRQRGRPGAACEHNASRADHLCRTSEQRLSCCCCIPEAAAASATNTGTPSRPLLFVGQQRQRCVRTRLPATTTSHNERTKLSTVACRAYLHTITSACDEHEDLVTASAPQRHQPRVHFGRGNQRRRRSRPQLRGPRHGRKR